MSETIRIVGVAFRANGVVLSMTKPHRHFHLVKQLPARLGNAKPNDQGFITSEGKFAGRIEALHIAKAAGQLLDPLRARGELYSEDLW